MDTRTPTPKVRKHIDLTPAENRALNLLIRAGYARPDNTNVAAFRRMLHTAWDETFPNKPFPAEEDSL